MTLLVSLALGSVGCACACSFAYRRMFAARDQKRAVAKWLWCLLGSFTAVGSGLLGLVAGRDWHDLTWILLIVFMAVMTSTVFAIDREQRRRRRSE